MPPAPIELDLDFLAVQWVRQELPPEDLPTLATNALVRGCDSVSLRLLAGIVGRPTSAEVHELMEDCFRDFGVLLPEVAGTSAWLVNRWLSMVDAGTVTPYEGAAQIAWLASEWWEEPCWDSLRPFIGLASEWDDHPHLREHLDELIRRETLNLVAAGGFDPGHADPS